MLESLLGHIILLEIDHEIISVIFLQLLLIHEGHLSVTGICVNKVLADGLEV